MTSYSISIPAYNDEATLAGLVEESLKVLSELTQDYEVVIIDDGSRDETGSIADRLAEHNPRVRAYHHKKNEGFGRTIKEVFLTPDREYVFFIPGDAQIPPAQLKQFVLNREKYDYILGLRRNRQDSSARKFYSAMYNLAVSLLGGKRVRDVNSVAFCRTEVMRSIGINSRSAFVHAEIYLKLLKKHYRIGEIEIATKPRQSGSSGAAKWGVAAATLREIAAYVAGKL